MLTQIQFKNYQAWKTLAIPLGRVTSLVGPTDAGKSSVLRGLWWALANQGPSNPGHHGTNDTAVAVTLDNLITITRTRSNKGNGYTVQPPSGPPIEYNAIRFDVPSEVRHLFNVHPHTYQRQHDSAFWLSNSPPEVGRALNAVVDLDVIDVGLTYAKKLEATAKSDLESLTRTIATTDTTLAELAWVPDAEAAWANYKALQAQHATLVATRGTLAARTRATVDCVAKARLANAYLGDVEAIEAIKTKARECYAKRAQIVGLLGRTVNELEGLRDDAAAVLAKRAACEAMKNIRTTLERVLAKIDKTIENYLDASDALDAIVVTQPVCPTCGKPT